MSLLYYGWIHTARRILFVLFGTVQPTAQVLPSRMIVTEAKNFVGRSRSRSVLALCKRRAVPTRALCARARAFILRTSQVSTIYAE